MRLEAVTINKLEAVLALMQRYYAFDHLEFDVPKQHHALERMLREDRGRTWLVHLDSHAEPVGYAVIVYSYSIEYAGLAAELDELYLEPVARGLGVGCQIMQAVLNELRALEVVVITLETEPDNESARAFYRRLGFQDLERKMMRLMLS